MRYGSFECLEEDPDEIASEYLDIQAEQYVKIQQALQDIQE